VDIRIRRSVRAEGFRDNNFENRVGRDRYRWMKNLGNESIITKAKRIKIADPSAADDLLKLAFEAGKQKQRLVFYCNCPYPMDGRRIGCHRTVVGRLLLDAARQQKRPVTVVEWPGGTPAQCDFDVSSQVFRSVRNGRVTIPLKRGFQLADVAGLPWGSVVTLESDGDSLHRLSGPAIYKKGKWCLEVMDWWRGEEFSLQEIKRESAAARKDYGYEPSYSL